MSDFHTLYIWIPKDVYTGHVDQVVGRKFSLLGFEGELVKLGYEFSSENELLRAEVALIQSKWGPGGTDCRIEVEGARLC